MPRKILIVANHASVHTAGWVEMIAEQGWEVSIYAIHHGLPHPKMKNITLFRPFRYIHPGLYFMSKVKNIKSDYLQIYTERNVKIKNISEVPCTPKLITIISGVVRVFCFLIGRRKRFTPFHGERTLLKVIEKIKPDIIHSMDFQQGGYLVDAAKKKSKTKNFPTWIATNWGSDLYYFQRFPEHKDAIQSALNNIDYYSCECERDIQLARDLGYDGKTLPVFPNSGGMDLDVAEKARSDIQPSERKTILIKGYQHFAGRALTALDAIEAVKDKLDGYDVVVFSAFACSDVVARVESMAATGMSICWLPYISKEELSDYFARSRIYLGVSISDAISTSLLEAMVYGAFPIQTDTSCCDEWIKDAESGFIIPADNVDIIADRLSKALDDDNLVDRAASINWEVARARLDKNIIRMKAKSFYDMAMPSIKNGNE